MLSISSTCLRFTPRISAPTTTWTIRRRLLSSKVYPNAAAALQGAPLDGTVVAVGGFGLGGNPETLIDALNQTETARNLTIVSLCGGTDDQGIGPLLQTPQKVKRLVSSYVGENAFLERAYFNGTLQIELTPQGTIAQRLRAAGYGMPGFYTPTGAGTIYAQGGIPIQFALDSNGQDVVLQSEPKETRTFHGTEYVLEHALHADVSLVKAKIADTAGNLVFAGTAQNSNPDCAVAGKLTVVEAETVVPAGTLKPDEIHLSGVFVHRVIEAVINQRPIERLKLASSHKNTVGGGRGRIMRRTAKEFQDGMYVNLGIGMVRTNCIICCLFVVDVRCYV